MRFKYYTKIPIQGWRKMTYHTKPCAIVGHAGRKVRVLYSSGDTRLVSPLYVHRRGR